MWCHFNCCGLSLEELECHIDDNSTLSQFKCPSCRGGATAIHSALLPALLEEVLNKLVQRDKSRWVVLP